MWAHKHWLPAFGFGGGYAGDAHNLRLLAWVVAGPGILAAVAAFAQLVVQHDWPRPGVTGVRWSRVGIGVVVLVGLPFLISTADSRLTDRTSLVALALIYSIPWGLSLVGSGWLSRDGVLGVLVACFSSAALSTLAPSIQITLGQARGTFAAMAVVFAILLVVGVRPTNVSPGRQGPAPRTADVATLR